MCGYVHVVCMYICICVYVLVYIIFDCICCYMYLRISYFGTCVNIKHVTKTDVFVHTSSTNTNFIYRHM
jgi:hypothetical protein